MFVCNLFILALSDPINSPESHQHVFSIFFFEKLPIVVLREVRPSVVYGNYILWENLISNCLFV